MPLSVGSVTDNFGTAASTADDFHPRYVGGDANSNNQLDPGETWLYTSSGVESYQAQPGLYVNYATAIATGPNGTPVTVTTPNYHFGSTPGLFVLKAINAVDPLHPTKAELAQAAPGRLLPIGTSVVWTYQVCDEGDAPVKITSVRDDAGTPNDPSDDFLATAVVQAGTQFNAGDTNRNGLLDPGEVFLFTSAGSSNGTPTDWNTVSQTVFSDTDTTGAGPTPGYTHDPVATPNAFADQIFTGGGSKDVNGVAQWQWKTQMPQDTDDIADAFGSTLVDSGTGHTLLFGGMDRYASNGNTTAGFWFFQGPVSINAKGAFNGRHTDGDLLLVVDFTVGGSNPVVNVFRWTGSDTSGKLVAMTVPANSTYLYVNNGPVSVPWSFIDKSGHTSPQAGELLKVGLDLTALLGANVPHFASFLAETRSSSSTTSTLSDFALGSVNAIGTTYRVKAGQYANTVTATAVDQATNLTVTATDTNYHYGVAAGPQLAAAPASGVQVGATLLTQDQLAPIVAEAIARWSVATDLPVDVLAEIPIEIADLPDGGDGRLPVLGYTSTGIQIDGNAGGFGWFIDPTPADDSEFLTLPGQPASPAAGTMDLLTVVMHEFGHIPSASPTPPREVEGPIAPVFQAVASFASAMRPVGDDFGQLARALHGGLPVVRDDHFDAAIAGLDDERPEFQHLPAEETATQPIEDAPSVAVIRKRPPGLRVRTSAWPDLPHGL